MPGGRSMAHENRSLLADEGVPEVPVRPEPVEDEPIDIRVRRPPRWAAVGFMLFLLCNCVLFYMRVGQHMFWLELANVGIFSALLWETLTPAGQSRNLIAEGVWNRDAVAINVALQCICCGGLGVHLVGDLTSIDANMRHIWELAASFVIAVGVLSPFGSDLIISLSRDKDAMGDRAA
eukprot:CAMPEP_0114546614 /NCGR_PEP_ID=MMETSP0114-20121206/4027_1 /TAXON_ID=31324 /ORGANISM="Goniomonas sp, Strain m" /LENGTH=177 /DNA_ID=CAMNT_0001731119 /DNA_START=704 /DNA_END=1237 /DNA_ORIENTATION=+